MYYVKFVVITTFTPTKLCLIYVILPNISYFKVTKKHYIFIYSETLWFLTFIMHALSQIVALLQNIHIKHWKHWPKGRYLSFLHSFHISIFLLLSTLEWQFLGLFSKPNILSWFSAIWIIYLLYQSCGKLYIGKYYLGIRYT